MIRLIIPLILLLLVSCAGTRNIGSVNEQIVRKSGEFTLHSEEMSGSGSVILRENNSQTQLFFYSPFGQKIAQMNRVGDSIETVSGGEKLSPQSINDPVVIPGVIEIETVTMGELFTLLAGNTTPLLDSLVQNRDVVSEQDNRAYTFSVKKRSGKVRKIEYRTDQYALLLESPRNEQFREIKLKLGRRNYFHIRYE